MATIPTTKQELLERWHKRLRETQSSHYEAAKPLGSMNLKLGIPVVVLTTFVGTSVFATLQKDVDLYVKLLVGFISVAAAVLASLQTFLRFSEKAETHRTTGAKAGSVRREVEQLLASGNIEAIPDERINRLREQIDEIANLAPSVSESIWKRVEENLKHE